VPSVRLHRMTDESTVYAISDMTTRTLDSKGRLTLGPEFANRLVIVDDSDATRIVITPATAVPSHEAWLYKNEAALKSVLLGLNQARGGQFASQSPDVDADAADD
jgi:hypothetical protein